MSHPMKKSAADAKAAKRSRMGVSRGETSNGFAPSKRAPNWPEQTDMSDTSIAGQRPLEKATPVDGESVRANLGRRGRQAYATGGGVSGGKGKVSTGKGKTSINIVIAPGAGGGGDKPVPVPVPVPAGPPPGMMPPGPPPMGPGGPMGAAPIPAGPSPGLGAGLPMRKRGGRVKSKRADGGAVDEKVSAEPERDQRVNSERDMSGKLIGFKKGGATKPHRASGGKVMAGAGSGLGRLQKARAAAKS